MSKSDGLPDPNIRLWDGTEADVSRAFPLKYKEIKALKGQGVTDQSLQEDTNGAVDKVLVFLIGKCTGRADVTVEQVDEMDFEDVQRALAYFTSRALRVLNEMRSNPNVPT